MKNKTRFALIATSIATAFTVAFAGDIAERAGVIKDAVLDKLLCFTAKKVVTKDFITTAMKSWHINFGGGGPISFHDTYLQARDTAYYRTFRGKDHPDFHPGEETDDSYFTMSSVVMPLMRDQIESKTTMMDIYMSCRDSWKAALRDEGPIFQQSLLESVNRAIGVLEKIRDPQFRDELQALENQKNGATAAVKAIKQRQNMEWVETPSLSVDKTRDSAFEGFVRRCFIRGGLETTDKYLALALQARKDLEEVIAESSKKTSTP